MKLLFFGERVIEMKNYATTQERKSFKFAQIWDRFDNWINFYYIKNLREFMNSSILASFMKIASNWMKFSQILNF